MIKYDDSSLIVEQRGKLPLFDGLEDFAMRLSLAKPMVNFVVNKECVTGKWVKDANGVPEKKHMTYIVGFVVYENGEELGAIGTDRRYRGRSDAELVYEVESFRINKSRGAKDTTQSKDIKVALRIAKKVLVARADDEAKELIRETLTSNINNLFNVGWTQVRWTINAGDEAFIYARMAYLARQRGEAQVILPSKLPTITDLKMHDEACSKSEDITVIKNLYVSDKGYGVQVLADGSLNVYAFADKSIKKYDGFYSLPEDIQGKYGMFKVLKAGEVVTTIGVKINDEFAYVVE